MRRVAPLLLLPLLLATPGATRGDDAPRPDRVIADFEGGAYAPGWTTTGTAFGTAPARGALPGQMAVEGFAGGGLVNSFLGGDDAEGTLTSPPFRIERRFINLLIGGGKAPGQTCVDLVIAGQVARTATGPNDQPGGSERLDWATWDVSDLQGQETTLRIVDRKKGGWGHINVDQVTQSDTRLGAARQTRAIVADRSFLHLPVRRSAPIRRVQISDGTGQVVRDFDIHLADDPTKVDFMAFLDLAPFRGQTLSVGADLPAGSQALGGLTPADQAVAAGSEADRPGFHFTSRVGWLNDPNGLVVQDGTYHLFYQHNPYGWDWGNMHWGHATSRDLVRWAEQPIALYPPKYGDMAFSGSAVIDRANTSGFGTPDKPALVAAFTSTGRGECIVYSQDKGQTWTEWAGNPVVRHIGRDPRLLWHEPTHRWSMAVYDEGPSGKDQAIDFYSSPDLKIWTRGGRIDGFFECPDLFELPVEGANPPRSLWVLSAADGKYRLGQFDGANFTPETDKLTLWHGDFYAAQTFSDTPDGRRIQIGWARGIDFPGMPFNQQMTVPCRLTLRATPDGPRLHAEPVAEVDRAGEARPGFIAINSGFGLDNEFFADRLDQLEAAPGDGLDLEVVVNVRTAGQLRIDLKGPLLQLQVPLLKPKAARGEIDLYGPTIGYDAATRTLDVDGLAVPLTPIDGSIRLRILLDRRSLEVFGNRGAVAVSRRIKHHSPVPVAKFARSKNCASMTVTARLIRPAR